MPWRAASPMDQRTQFIADFLRDALSITGELCALYGIARKTGYRWIDRYLPTGRQAWRSARGVAAIPYHRPLQLLVIRRRQPQFLALPQYT